MLERLLILLNLKLHLLDPILLIIEVNLENHQYLQPHLIWHLKKRKWNF